MTQNTAPKQNPQYPQKSPQKTPQDPQNRPGPRNQANPQPDRKDGGAGAGQPRPSPSPDQKADPVKEQANAPRSGESNSKDDERGEPCRERPGQGSSTR